MYQARLRLGWVCWRGASVTTRAFAGVDDIRYNKIKQSQELKVSQAHKNIYNSTANTVFKPVHVPTEPRNEALGEELAGKIHRTVLLKLLNKFYMSDEIRDLCQENGLDHYLQHQAYISFRKQCMNVDSLPTDLYITLSDLLRGAGHLHDIFPYFMRHARKAFPHLECLEELKGIGDLTDPTKWYPEARAMQRKIIFHSGPTNSGKTYHAIERFKKADSAVYCGPLKLLAVEVYNKINASGVDCDLITGEERKYAREDKEPASHVSCTVEMTNCSRAYEVAVIDEIQMIKDEQRGWAWTRALLGVPAEEIHVCGEKAAVDIVRELMISTGEEVEVRQYNRLTSMVIEDEALGSLENVQPGDCIVCFNKQHIFSVSKTLESLGIECAVIYGSLPPGPKLAMAEKFNNPNDSCKVLVATDAVGMGLNLNIRRIIFYSISKFRQKPSGEKEMEVLSVSQIESNDATVFDFPLKSEQALQIAGRAGRYNTQWETGRVTCFHPDDMPVMNNLLSQTPPEILNAGLHPTFEQLEMYAYHLPHATLSNLIDIFLSLSTTDDSLYELCHLREFKALADMIEYISMPIKTKYTFCCAPINIRNQFVCSTFVKIARQFSSGKTVTFKWLSHVIGWPFAPPTILEDLFHLEAVHDVLDLYLWLGYRFPDMMPDVESVLNIRTELENIVEEAVGHIVELVKSTDQIDVNLPRSPGPRNMKKPKGPARSRTRR